MNELKKHKILNLISKGIKNPGKIHLFLHGRLTRWFVRTILPSALKAYNILPHAMCHQPLKSTGLKELDEVNARSLDESEISDHLPNLFIQALKKNPGLIVELGVDVGQSTYALERVAKLCSSALVSVDKMDCRDGSSYQDWEFVQSDDIEFAKIFEVWCSKKNIEPVIDVLFIDTSHLYEQTLSEIKNWFQFLSADAKVFFHDTNLSTIYSRKNGTLGRAWNNHRGVIKALETFFSTRFDEKRPFTEIHKGWLIQHSPNCNGFTVLEKIGSIPSTE